MLKYFSIKSSFLSILVLLLTLGCKPPKQSPNTVAENIPPIKKEEQLTTKDLSVGLLSISVKPKKRRIPIGIPQEYKAIGFYSGGRKRDITHLVTWSSADKTTATIAANSGKVTGYATGKTKIIAKLAKITGKGRLRVTTTPIVSIKITSPKNADKMPTVTSIPVQFRVTGNMRDKTTIDLTKLVTWQSSDPNKVRINNDSDSKGIAIGVETGKPTITAFWGGLSDEITVISNKLSHITIDSDTNVIGIGGTAKLTATATYSDNSTEDVTKFVNWTASKGKANATYATVGNTDGKKGIATGKSFGCSIATARLEKTDVSKAITVTEIAPTFIKSFGGYDITIPNSVTVIENTDSDFTGIFYQGKTGKTSGFIGTYNEIDETITNCILFANKIVTAISANTNTSSVNTDIGSTTIGNASGNCSQSKTLSVTTTSAMNATQFSNLLAEMVSTSVGGVAVDINNISAQSSEKIVSSFKLRLQATYSSSGNELVGIGVNYANSSSTANNIHDGTNTTTTAIEKLEKIDSYTSSGASKVDIVWVVDNSSSMSEEQAAVSANAKDFFTSLANKSLDFRLGVLATGSRGSNSDTLNPGGEKAWELWGSGWVTASNGSKAFSQNVDAVQIDGSGKESGIFFAERALGVKQNPQTYIQNGGTNTVKATIIPRADAKLVFIMLSDEGDHYFHYSETAFDPNSNIFVKNNYKVYSIIGLNSETQLPGTCSGSGTSASNANTSDTSYYQLASATGGSSGTICTNDYSSLLNGIASEVAAFSSKYILKKAPISNSLVVKVNGVVARQSESDGWTYKSGANSIVFSGASVPKKGTPVEVSYIYNDESGISKKEKSNTLPTDCITPTEDTSDLKVGFIALFFLVFLFGGAYIWVRTNVYI
ncbi:MAG: Ig-like domain-containing protein [Spirochaetota bacterium]